MKEWPLPAYAPWAPGFLATLNANLALPLRPLPVLPPFVPVPSHRFLRLCPPPVGGIGPKRVAEETTGSHPIALNVGLMLVL